MTTRWGIEPARRLVLHDGRDLRRPVGGVDLDEAEPGLLPRGRRRGAELGGVPTARAGRPRARRAFRAAAAPIRVARRQWGDSPDKLE